MGDEIPEVDQHPTSFGTPLSPNRMNTTLAKHVLDPIRDRYDISLAASAHDQECVHKGQRLGHIDSDDLLTALIVGGGRRDPCEVEGLV